MSEPKPLASLSSSLLARKGDARPAIRRAYVPLAPISRLPQTDASEDLGWNDMGDEAHSPVRQQERIERSYSANPKAASRKTKAAFTLRLDADRSSQQIVTEALDAFLEGQPGLDALFDEARGRSGS